MDDCMINKVVAYVGTHHPRVNMTLLLRVQSKIRKLNIEDFSDEYEKKGFIDRSFVQDIMVDSDFDVRTYKLIAWSISLEFSLGKYRKKL